MSPEKQRVAIAETCGWTDKRIPTLAPNVDLGTCWISPKGHFHETCPDYPNDLNAMHEAASYLRNANREAYNDYGKHLQMLVAKWNSAPDNELHHSMLVCDAPAEFRSESFLKAVGRWQE